MSKVLFTRLVLFSLVMAMLIRVVILPVIFPGQPVTPIHKQLLECAALAWLSSLIFINTPGDDLQDRPEAG